jgi:hypothetical protein
MVAARRWPPGRHRAALYASGQSSKARGLTAETIAPLPVTISPPTKLVELTFAADRVLTY